VTPGELARLIDHTLLRADATAADVETLCDEAVRFGFATVCVNPTWTGSCAARLRETRVGVCVVAGFPLGATTPEVKAAEARQALEAGAAEIDMVINIGALRSGDLALVARDLAAVVRPCAEAGAVTKVIIEAALLTDREKRLACRAAVEAGAGFVKTSTGFGPGGATAPDVALMAMAVAGAAGVKAAGGVRTLQDVRALVTAGATRIGTSAGVAIMREAGA